MEKLSEMERVIRLALIKIGIKCDFIGYTYLAHAAKMVVDEPMLVHDLKSLFAKVAKLCNVKNPFRVEANIQNAINYTYNNRGFSGINDLFGMEVCGAEHKPTIAEIVKLISEYYLLGLYEDAM